MILCDKSLKEMVTSGAIVIDPEPHWEEQLQPASIDLRLGGEFSRFKKFYGPPPVIVPGVTDIRGMMEDFKANSYQIAPGEFLLANIVEYIEVPRNMAGAIEGRSSYARLGLVVHVTAGFLDPGFKGNVTLELANMGPCSIELVAGRRICQVVFEKLDGDATPYRGKYQNQRHVTPSRLAAGKL